MKIKQINSQNRRDFYADYECEHCEHVEKDRGGYDDDNFHQNVIPDMVCPQCKKKSNKNYRPLKTKYDAYEVI